MVVAGATRNHSSHKEEEEGSTNSRRGSNIQESQVHGSKTSVAIFNVFCSIFLPMVLNFN